MEQFIREKIKDKPLNKKRLAKKAGTAALCGVAFAVAASIVFAIFLPVINRQSKKASDGKNNNDVQIATQQPGIDDSNDAYSENGTQSTESGTSSEPFFADLSAYTRRLSGSAEPALQRGRFGLEICSRSHGCDRCH